MAYSRRGQWTTRLLDRSRDADLKVTLQIHFGHRGDTLCRNQLDYWIEIRLPIHPARRAVEFGRAREQTERLNRRLFFGHRTEGLITPGIHIMEDTPDRGGA